MQLTVTLLHTNDVHSNVEMVTASGAPCLDLEARKFVCFGGYSRRASFIKAERAKDNLLLLDAGDQFHGSPWHHVYKGRETSFFMNLLNYTAIAIGTHAFDQSLESLEEVLSNFTTHIICCNLKLATATGFFQRIEPMSTYDYKNHKIHIVGYITEKVALSGRAGPLQFVEHVTRVQETVQRIKRSGNIIIALGHAGYEMDIKMAKIVPDLDIIVGGKSHTLLHTKSWPFKCFHIWQIPQL
ncbi:hypothetical protein HELRODRAFT_75190 [Helobdella robusta]|uniref:5'-nucleotidase n=1 Tax=Helobdella robusta TaxID=6412 RepID=T1G224_HELRO|nr:hypothetical protein HELRODRAFT_75190 [Helobdella robusta]ESO07961.1 hypothetical protein HELRODRAFT_75190 [Helobdella robusta]